MATKVKVQDIVQLTSSVLRKNGLSEDDTNVVISHLLDGELSGKSSHGFYRIPGIVRVLQKNGVSEGSIIYDKETPSSALLNGNGRLGLVVAQKATEIAIEKAASSSISIVGAHNYIGTTGAMGHYSRQIAERNLVGIVICNSELAVAPTGGKKAILGTNPISISIPTGGHPIVVDLATSAWSYGDLALAMKENRRIPEGIVIDKDGNPSTDPNDADNGSQLPMAGHKGYALGLAIEILAGPLVRAKAGRAAVPGTDGLLIVVFDPELFTTIGNFKSDVDALVDEIKNSPLAPDSTGIYIPGEQSNQTRLKNEHTDYIEVSEAIFNDIQNLSR